MKKVRKSKRKNFKDPVLYSVKKFFDDAKICRRTNGEYRKIFLEETSKVYLKWIKEREKKGLFQETLKEIMQNLEDRLGIQNNFREEAEKNKIIDPIWSEKQQDKADEILGQCRFVLDVIGFSKNTDSSEFLNPINKK